MIKGAKLRKESQSKHEALTAGAAPSGLLRGDSGGSTISVKSLSAEILNRSPQRYFCFRRWLFYLHKRTIVSEVVESRRPKQTSDVSRPL